MSPFPRLRPAASTLLALAATASALAAPLPVPDPDDGAIRLPPGFRAVVVADNLVVGRERQFGRTASGDMSETLRFLAVTPGGDLYAKLKRGPLLALRDHDGDGRMDEVREFGAGGGTAVAVHGEWLYESTTTEVRRYRLTPGALVPAGPPEIIVTDLPAGPQHDAKCFTFDDEGRLYVEVGSPYNVYSEPDRQEGARGLDPTEFLKTHGGIWRFDPAQPRQTITDGHHYSTGHRHMLAFAWNRPAGAIYGVMMGRDQMNTVAPQFYDAYDNAGRIAEEMHVLREGANLGWPFTYFDPVKQARMVNPEFGGDGRLRAEPGKYPDPLIAFPPHSAPLQMAFYPGTQFPARYRRGAFIAFHGSWNRAPQPQIPGYVAFVPFDEQGRPSGPYEVFADGFAGLERDFTDTADARFRPCGLAVGPDGSLYLGETQKGRIWRVIYTGEERAPASAGRARTAVPAGRADAPDASPGGRVYARSCAVCHMPGGGGVAGMQPALRGSARIAGDPDRLVDLILRGPAACSRRTARNSATPCRRSTPC